MPNTVKQTKPTTRKRIQTPKIPLADYIYKHSPLKKGLKVKDENQPLTNYNKITSRIFLGNIKAAKDKQFFKDNKITAVLNCSKEIPNYFQNSSHIEYMRIPVDDSLKQKDFDLMFEFTPAAVEFINKHTNVQKNNIFIHCHMGRQRSVCCLVNFMVSKCGFTPQEACKMVLKKRPEAFHFGESLNFDQTINKYYKMVSKMQK